MSQITIPGLPNNPTPAQTVLFEISNAGVSENVTLASIIVGLQKESEKNQPNGYPGLDGSSLIAESQIPELAQSKITDLVADLALKEDLANKGAVSGYAGLDATALLELANYPTGNALEFLRRDAANTALEFAVITPTPQTPIESDIDYADFSVLNLHSTTLNEISEPTTPAAGKVIFWTEDIGGTSALRYKASDGIAQTILENQVISVRNSSGGTLFKGEAVYMTGANTQKITVDRAQADSDSTIPAIGVIEQDITNNSNGFVLIQGILDTYDTSSFSTGDLVALSATVAGGLTNVAPTHPNVSQILGVVINSNVNGSLAVVTGQISGIEQGTNRNVYQIGDGLVGPKQIQITNDFVQTLSFNPTANRTLTFPNVTDVMVARTTPDTLTSKTIAFGSNTITTTLAQLQTAVTDATLVDLDDAQTLTTKSIDALTNTITNIGSSEVIPDIITGQTLKATPVGADEILLSDSAAAGALKRTTLTTLLSAGQTPWLQNIDAATFNIINLSAINTNTIPPGTDIFAMLAAAQLLTNKSIDFASNTITSTFAELNTAVSDATLVDLASFQALTNKTINASLNSVLGVSAITGLGVQVQDLAMAANNILFDTTTGGQIATSATQKIAFYGNTPIVQPIDGATLTNNVTVGGTTDQIDDFTDLSVYANDAATIRNDIYQLARKVKIITDNLRTLGLES